MRQIYRRILFPILFTVIFTTLYASGPSLTLKSSWGTTLFRPTRIAVNNKSSIAVVEYHRKQINIFNESRRLLYSVPVSQAPLSVAFTADDNLYAGVENDVLKLNANGEVIDKFSLHGFTPKFPSDIDVDAAGSVYVVDREQCKVFVCNQIGEIKYSFGSAGSQQGEFRSPVGIAIDETAGELIIGDAGNSRIQVFSLGGEFRRMFGQHIKQIDTAWQTVGTFARIQGVAVDTRHRIYVTDSGLDHVQIFDAVGNHLGFIGKEGLRNSRLRVPMGIKACKSERLFITSMAGSEIKEYTIQSATDVSSQPIETPKEFVLEQNYPNPFNPSTRINFSLPEREWVTLKIYDVIGREVVVLANEDYKSGKYTIEWDGRNSAGVSTSSGIYFYHLQAGEKYSQTNKMVFLK